MRFLLLLLCSICFSLSIFGQSGHRIEVKIDGYDQDLLYLAYHYGDKQYVADTTKRQTNGSFVFEGDEPLEPGYYMLVFDPDYQTFDLLIDADEQNFSLSMQMDNMLESVEITGSSGENQLFFNYLKYLNQKRAAVTALKNEETGSIDDSSSETKSIEQKTEQISAEVNAYQKQLVKENPASFTALIINSTLPVEYPEFEGTEKEIKNQGYRYTVTHFLDNINLNDDRLNRTSILHSKVDYYVNKLHVTDPDTLSAAIDHVISQMDPRGKNYQYTVVHFLNQFAKSRTIGMDAVYVHIAEKYYQGGNAYWSDEATTKKVVNNAAALKPLLIGKTAPNPKLLDKAGNAFNLHDLVAKYTILYFWRYDCDRCKETSPQLDAVYQKFKDRGVKLLAVCTKGSNEAAGCWDYADANQLNGWVHGSVTDFVDNATEAFMVTSTPLIYVLDSDKVILTKRVDPEQLEKLFNFWLN